jgi:hypothetical protein
MTKGLERVNSYDYSFIGIRMGVGGWMVYLGVSAMTPQNEKELAEFGAEWR